MQIVGDRSVRIVPDVAVTGSSGAATGLVEALLGAALKQGGPQNLGTITQG